MEQNCDCNIIHKDAVDIALNKMIDDEYIKRLTNLYKIIGEGTRLKILLILEHHEMCVCDIAYSLNMTKSAISHQLKILKDNELIKSEKRGKEVYYTIIDKHVSDLIKITTEHIKEKI